MAGSTKQLCDSVSLPTALHPQPQGDLSPPSSHLCPLLGTQGAVPAWGTCLVDSAPLHQSHPRVRTQCSKARNRRLDPRVLLTICNQANRLITQVLISCPSCPPLPVPRHLQWELLILGWVLSLVFPGAPKTIFLLVELACG